MFQKGLSKTDHITGLLSEYIDNRLPAQERHRLEAHLAACPQCQEELASLRATVTMLRALPPVPVPRGFYVYRERARARAPLFNLRAIFRPGLAGAGLRFATAVVTLLFVVVLSADIFTHLLLPQAAAPAPIALRQAPTPSGGEKDLREFTAPAGPTIGAVVPTPQPRVLGVSPQATPSPVPMAAPLPPKGPTPEGMAPSLPQPTPSPVAAPALILPGLALWRAAELSLGILAIALILLAWRARGP